jgi:hypothetical protein
MFIQCRYSIITLCKETICIQDHRHDLQETHTKSIHNNRYNNITTQQKKHTQCNLKKE